MHKLIRREMLISCPFSQHYPSLLILFKEMTFIMKGKTRCKKCERVIYIDLLRIVACLMVIFNHTNERGFYRYVSDTPGSFWSIWNLIFSIACKSAVPIFFMISGAMLLDKEESLNVTYKRICKFLVDLILFSLAYFWGDSYLEGRDFCIRDVLGTIIQNNYWHLWYLYAYIALIVTLPFLRNFAKSVSVQNPVS